MPKRNKVQTKQELTRQFWGSPDEALHPTPVIAAVFDSSEAKLERDRWQGVGLPYVKIDGLVRYRKSDVLAQIEKSAVTPTPAAPRKQAATAEATA
jgi:hypothetical protein